MPSRAARSILLGYAIPLAAAFGLLLLGRSRWSPGPGPGGAALVVVATLVVVPLATGCLVAGTGEALRAMRASGWRVGPAAWLLAALGAAGSAAGLAAVLAFVGSCALDALVGTGGYRGVA